MPRCSAGGRSMTPLALWGQAIAVEGIGGGRNRAVLRLRTATADHDEKAAMTPP